jgi:hypothetical protein
MLAKSLQPWADQWKPDTQWLNLPVAHREDLPALFASAEHRAWILGIEGFLNGEREAFPRMDEHQCRFGSWLNADGLVRYGAQPVFEAIQRMHLQVHALARELHARRLEGDNLGALSRMGEIHAMSEALLAQLTLLLHQNSSSDRTRPAISP